MIEVDRRIACQADICSLWNALGDTERLNRAIGNNAVAMQALEKDSAARYVAKTNLGGFNVTYDERPYEWVYLERFSIVRKMHNGPVEQLEAQYRFQRTPAGGTDVSVHIAMKPRMFLLGPAVKISARQVLNRMEREIKAIDTGIVAGRGVPPLKPIHAANETAVQRASVELLRHVPPELTRRLVELVREGSDLDVARIRPFALADQWKLDRRAVLSACLYAVRAGLLELHWDLICPSCRTVAESMPSLASLADHGRCQLCDIDFGLDLDEAVEATFSPATPVRKVDDRKYCIGGPARTPHVFAQAILPSGGEASLKAPEEAGRYRLFVRGGRTTQVKLEVGAAAEVATTIDDERLISIAPNGLLKVRNTGSERHVKLERVEWISQAATARYVSTMPAFRREFSSDTLRPGTSLKVARVTILFTDLTDSTKLYAKIGDAAAFRLVQDHFDLLLPIIETNEGALVKTIGDAIMAVFAEEDGAVRTAVAMLEAFEPFRRDQPHGQATHIKIGLFSGPCFAITANNVLDYFGQSVNVAARLQGKANSGEVVMEANATDTALERGLLGRAKVIERAETSLKGVDGVLQIARLSL